MSEKAKIIAAVRGFSDEMLVAMFESDRTGWDDDTFVESAECDDAMIKNMIASLNGADAKSAVDLANYAMMCYRRAKRR